MNEGIHNLCQAKGKVAQWNAAGNQRTSVGWTTGFRSREIPIHKKILLICQLAVCLPGTNAPVERIFSIINNTIHTRTHARTHTHTHTIAIN